MASNGGRINFQVGFNVDKSGLNSLKSSLQSLQKIKIADFSGTKEQLKQVKDTAAAVQIALQKAFNVNLGSVNLNTFNQSLKESNLNIDKVYQNLSKAGGQGKAAFMQMSGSIMSTNIQLRETTSLVSKMGQTMANTIKWGITSSIMQGFTNSVRQAFQYVQALDASLTDIRIVTGDSTEQMREFARQANNAAQNLGRSTMDYTKAALTFYQQGLDDQSVAARTQATLQAQNITGAGQEMADYLTAVWNGYRVANEQAELYVDRLAAVADSSASNMAQLATAMSKVAATANAMGVDVDQLNAQIATIIATTRQAPQTVGNALKTIFARINDIQAGTEDAEVSLGHYTGAMAELGINVLDTSGHLRDTGQVMEEIGQKWQTMSREQQIYLARTMAGQRQYNNLIALFDNWGRYTELVNVSMDSQGTLMEKNSRYMDSMGAKMEQLGAAGEKVKDALIDEEDMKGLITAAANIVNVFGSFIQSIGGARGALLAFGSIAMQVFSGTISKQISNLVLNLQNAKQNQALLNQEIQKVKFLSQSKGYSEGLIKDLVDQKAAIQSYYSVMTNEQIKQYNALHQQYVQQKANLELYSDQKLRVEQISQAVHDLATKSGVEEQESLKQIGQIINQDLFPKFQRISQIKLISQKQFETQGLGALRPFAQLQSDLKKLQAQTGETFPQIQNYLDKLNQMKVNPFGNTLQDFKDLRMYALQVQSATRNALDGMGQQYDQLSSKTRQAQMEANGLAAAMKRIQDQKALEYGIKSAVQFVSALGRVASGINSLINLTKIWKNENLSTGEKILQTITNLTMAIPMLATGLMAVFSGIPKILTGITASIIANFTTLEAEDAALVMANITVAESFKLIGTVIGPLLPIIIPIAAAIGAVVAISVSLYKAWNSASVAAQRAAESAANAKARYNQLKEAYDNLKQSLQDYTQAQNALDQLTQGTQEWKQALLEANNAVLELLQTYPKLAQYISNQNGRLTISEEGQQAILEQQARIVRNAQAESLLAAARSRTASSRATAADIGHNTLNGYFTGITGSPDDIIAIADALNSLPDFDTGNLQHGLIDLADQVSQLTGVGINEVVAVLGDNGDRVLALSAELRNNQQSLQTTNEILAGLALENNETYQNLSQTGQRLAEILGANLIEQNTEVDENISRMMAYAMQNAQFASSSLLQDWLQKYNQSQGTDYNFASNAITGFAATGSLRINLDDGTEQGLHLRVEDFLSSIISGEALNQIENSALQTIQNIERDIRDSNISTQAQGAIVDWIDNNDLSGLTASDLIDISTGRLELTDILDEDSIQVLANFWGISVDQVSTRFQQAAQNAETALQRIPDNLVEQVRNAYKSLDLNDATASQRQQIANSLAQAFRTGGSEALDSLTQFYNGIDDFDVLDELNSQFNFMYGTTDELQQALYDAGIQTKFTDQQLQAYINHMKQLGEVLNPEENYANLHQIIDNLAFNDTISDEDDINTIRNVLQEHGLNLEDYFDLQLDGSYQLRASAQQFYDLINGFSLEPFEQRIHTIQEELGQLGSWEGNEYSSSVLGVQGFNEFSTNAMDKQGQINAKLAQAQVDFLSAIESSLNEQQQDVISIIQDFLANGGSITDLSAQQYQQLSEIISQHRGQWEDIPGTIEQARRQLEIYQDQLANGTNFIDADVDTEQLDELATHLENYADQLDDVDDAVQDNRQVALDLAEAILRYNHALEETINNYDTWLAMLQSGNWQDHVQAVSQLRNTYADLLDLPFEAELSDAFLSNVDNLNLLRQAAEGSEEAYDRLRQLAAQDLLIQVGVDPSQFNADVDWMQQAIRAFTGQDFGDIQVGAELNNQAFLDGLSDMVNAAGMTAQQATDYLSSMGIDAEVTTADNWSQGTQELQDAIPSVKYKTPIEYPTVVGGRLGVMKSMLPTIEYDASGYKKTSKTKHNTPATAVRVVSAHKSSGGNFKFNHASNGSGSSHPSGGGGSGGKGGGGSSSKPATPTIQKSSQDQRDPYHDINRLLDKQKEKLDAIQKEDKKLVNRDRLVNIQAQNKALEEQANLLENKLAIAESQEIRLRNQLLADTNGYAQFGANGQITNFNQMLANAEKQYNDYIAYYNTLSKQQQDAEKDRLDLEKERYQRVKKTADEYEKTLDLQRDLLEQINEAQEKIYQNMIKQSQIRVDLAVDTGDLEREYLDFENKFIKKLDKDNFLGNAKANVKELMSYFNSDQIKKRNEEINSLNAIIQRIEKHGGGAYVDPSTGYNLAAAQERLSELFKDQTKALEEIDDLVKEIQEIYLDSLKDAKDKMDDQIDQYERVGELIEHNAKLAQLIYGDKAYASLEKYYALQQRNDQRILNNLRMQQQYWQSQLDNEVVGSDAWLEIKKNLDDITDDLNNKLEDMIDRLADQWQVRVKKITDQVNNSMTGGRGLDYLNEQWDYISDYDDNFLDTLESKFGIQQVETLYQQAIDSIQGDPRGQQRLNKLMNDQLKLLRQKDKLTEYDVERAKAALEVEKARMAIEQARDSKTKMRLRRDSQGNYTYQYVADENKLSDLQQALNDAQTNLYNMDKQHYTQNLNNIYDAWKEFQQKLQKLQLQYAKADAANNEQEKKRVNDRIQLLKDSYSRLFDGLTEDNKYNLKYLAQSFGEGMGFTKAQQQAENFIKIMEQNIPHVGGDVQNLTNTITSEGGLLNALGELENSFNLSNMQYVNGIRTYLAEAGTSVETIMKVADAYGNAMDTAINKAQEFIPYYDKMIADSVYAIDQVRKRIEQVEKVLDKNLDDSSLVKTLETAVNLLQDLNRYRNLKTGQIAKDVNIKAPNVVDRNIDTTEEGAGVITVQDWKNYLNNQSTSQPITLASINAIGQLDADTLNSLSNEDVLLNVIGTIKYLTDSMGAMVNQQIGSMIKEASSYIGNIENVEKLDQNVHIEANFPNVIQAEEIKAAFNNLVNMAAQTAYKPNTT